jgi:fructose-1,6-bisphosphatase I
MASEEEEGVIHIPEPYGQGRYTIAFDPLDGSSNIDANVSIGTIFAVHRRISTGTKGTVEDLLQSGRRLVAAGYVVYGSSTMLVISTGNGVHGFTLDPSVGAFLRSHPDMRIPRRGHVYSVNEGNYPYWSEGVKRFVNHIKERDPASDRPYTARYIGSLVADIHRTLCYGGIFMYPKDRKDPDNPKGKLRLVYECAPMAFILEQAGGAATTGREPILDIQPVSLHQRVPFYAGSVETVHEVSRFIEKYNVKPAAAAES